MAYLICYDISSNSLRAKMGRKIIEFGLDRINKSLYLGAITEGRTATDIPTPFSMHASQEKDVETRTRVSTHQNLAINPVFPARPPNSYRPRGFPCHSKE